MHLLSLRAQVVTEILQNEAGKNSGDDRWHCGYIAAVNDILRISLEDVEENME